jgi:hypothetical protein
MDVEEFRTKPSWEANIVDRSQSRPGSTVCEGPPSWGKVAPPVGIEPTTPGLGNLCSIH